MHPGNVCVYALQAFLIATAFGSRITESSDVSSSSSSSSIQKCARDHTVNVMEVDDSMFQRFEITPSNDFKYLQISMKLVSCYARPVFRGNRFLSGEKIGANQTRGGVVYLNVSYKNMDGKHGYHISIPSEDSIYNDDVDTDEGCGRCLGFRVKAVGASICSSVHLQQEKIMTAEEGQPGNINDGEFEIEQDENVSSRGTENDGESRITQELRGIKTGNRRLPNRRDFISNIKQLLLFVHWSYLVFVIFLMVFSFFLFMVNFCIKNRKFHYGKVPEEPAGTI